MKSIIEEASSISKAIENGWIKAGKPKDFSVKIFEEPVKGFFGITIKSAKIGIFFQESNPKDLKLEESSISKEMQKDIQKSFALEEKGKNIKSPQTVWSESMINTIDNWLIDIFENVSNKKITFNIAQNSFQLNIHISSIIFDDKNKEKKLFSSLSILIMQMLKKHYKRPFKGYRINFINNI